MMQANSRTSLPAEQMALMLVMAAAAFQAVPVIRFGAYSTIKIVDLSLIFFFLVAATRSLHFRTWISAAVIISAVIGHELLFSTSGKNSNWIPALIFMGRIMLITSVVTEYIAIDDKRQINDRLFRLYIHLVHFSIAYSAYESYLLLNGLAPVLVPEIINGAGEPISRLRGMFSEPSLFVLFLTPAFLAQIYRKAYASATLIGIALVLTVSTFAVVVLGIVLILFSNPRNALMIGIATCLAVGIAVYAFGGDFVVYSFFDKFWTYFSFSATTDIISDSAGIRKTTADFGMKIAEEYFPMGVGYGKSVARLRAEFPEALITAGIISPDIPIQSAFPQLLAESGIFGLIAAGPLLSTVPFLMRTLQWRQVLAFALYLAYMLIIIYPLENPIVWVFSLLFVLAMNFAPAHQEASGNLAIVPQPAPAELP